MKIINFEIIEEDSSVRNNHKYFQYLKENLGCHPMIFKVKLEEDPNNFYYLSPKDDSNLSYKRCQGCVFSIDSYKSYKHREKFTYADGKKTCLYCSTEFCDSVQECLEKNIGAMNPTLHKKIINNLIFLDDEEVELDGSRFFSTHISPASLRKHFCEVYCPLEKNQHMKNRCWEKEETCILKNLIEDIELK